MRLLLRYPQPLLVLSVLFLLSGCDAITGKEIARLTVDTISTEARLVEREVSLPLKKDDEIAIWSHMDLAYDGDAVLRFKVRIVQPDSTELPMLELDPMEKNITVGEVKSDLGGHTEWSFTGKNHEVKIPADGTYTFKTILVAQDNASLQVKKAELILKK